ncbi:hypothetical protein MKW94_000830 [Papaver nudicaule]|uniref:F-box domain-containing protein n=1 Tax=Papaver nudicaule TaxID=74823 RepID=A0AA41UUL6_PAPNU|nr:hypothetical protein [Papaver nudicaule]
MSSLPEDIIINVLTRLPIKSLLRFRCVCKSWCNNLFTDPDFVKQQFDHALKHHNPVILIDSTDFNISCIGYDLVSSTVSSDDHIVEIDYPTENEKYQIIDVCHGLLCYITENKDIIIWNPYTKNYKKLPSPPEAHQSPMVEYGYGFGYDSKTEDYKFARMVSYQFGHGELNVYSSRTDSWKTMVNVPFLYPYEQLVLFNGVFHWVQSSTLDSGFPRVIGSFDLESETFKEIQLPVEFLDRNKFTVVDLRFLEGNLYLIGRIYMAGVEVWMMKEYGVRESWTKMFTIDSQKFGGAAGYLTLKNSLGNGVIAVEVDHLHHYLYDLNKEDATQLEINMPFFIWAFLGSLVSPACWGTQ